MWDKFLGSPYVLAFLVGVHPILFFITNNWFMFEPSHTLSLFITFSLVIFTVLSCYHLALSWFVRKLFTNSPARITLGLFVLVSILVWAYLLKHAFLPMFKGKLFLFLLIIFLVASTLAWFISKIQLFRLNIVLGVMCLFQLGIGLNSLISAKITSENVFEKYDNELSRTIYEQVKFFKKPNIYYIVPDDYPNREALEKIFDIGNKDFYEQLESQGFTIYPSAFSNYMATLYSVSSTFGMNHHFYQGSIGNFEMLDSRKFIVSEQNPVVHIFKNNGYQVFYVHEVDYLLKRGCFVDSCSPSVSRWGEFFDILIPPRLHAIPLFKRVIKPISLLRETKDKEQTLSEFMPRVLRHIDLISAQNTPHFTYIHARQSGHSSTGKQTLDELASFRKNYFTRIQIANNTIMKLVEHILSRDSNALIIINADHGGWGYGNYVFAKNEVFEGTPDDLIALDHLGVLLAIRWPENTVPEFGQNIRTNLNLFRYIFAYLSENQDILTTKIPDDGFLTKGQGRDGILMKAIGDGKILEHMIEMGVLSKMNSTTKVVSEMN